MMRQVDGTSSPSAYRATSPFKNSSPARLAKHASRALSRRTKESALLKQQKEAQSKEAIEADYDKTPSQLYKMIERKDWNGAIVRAKVAPIEVRTWMYRRINSDNPNSKIRWRILPIHAAVIFRSPVSLVDALIETFPEGPKLTDDQKMLPLHLASRIVAERSVVCALLNAYPDGAQALDWKKRTPLRLAEDGLKTETKDEKKEERADMIEMMKNVLKKKDLNGSPSPRASSQNDTEKHDEDLYSTDTVVSDQTRDESTHTTNSGGSTPRAANTVAKETESEKETEKKEIAVNMDGMEGRDDKEAELPPEKPKVVRLPPINAGKPPRAFFQDRDPPNLQGEDMRPPVDPAKVEKKIRMVKPKETLKNLLDIISKPVVIEPVSAADGEFDVEANHTRRLNACGALKTLTTTTKNRVALVRTEGVVASLAYVLCDFSSIFEERFRCIRALSNLSETPKNQRILFRLEGLRGALTKALTDAYPRIRHGAATVLSILARNDKNRSEIINDKQMIVALVDVVNEASIVCAEHDAVRAMVEIEKGSESALPVNGSTTNDSISVGKDVLQRVITEEEREVWVCARRSAMTTFLHLSKVPQTTRDIARSGPIMTTLMRNAGKMDPDVNTVCVVTMANLTRLASNALYLVYHVSAFVPTIVAETASANLDCSRYAMCALQNLSCSKPCRQQLANTPNLLTSVSRAAFQTVDGQAQLAALHTLRSLSDESGNIVAITDTPGCMATLVALANDPSDDKLQYIACDALSTLSLSFRDSAERGAKKGNTRYAEQNIHIGYGPSLRVSTYAEWK